MYSPPGRVSAVNVQTIMREIRTVVRAANREHHDAARSAKRAIPGHLAAVIARLKASTASLEDAVSRIGEVPPGPRTLRARAGAVVVKVMQRALFWLVPSVRSTQQNIVQALRDHVAVTDEILKALHQTNLQMELLRRSMPATQEDSFEESLDGAAARRRA
jgi:hypothetical protein